ncbi:hypothetical protein WKI13_02195 [Teredinibacter turnerae]|uniref:hypothetical protein n=1 Tax=Teredinibacter turnerae TaxID=2426 RepID=UPI00035C4549|nr:hypothetical protein [Teredinibacter turnerae]
MSTPATAVHAVEQAIYETPEVKTVHAIFRVVMDTGFSMVQPLLYVGQGERVVTVFYTAVMFSAVFGLCHFYKVDPLWISGFLGLNALATCYHLGQIWWRNKKDILWHSLYPGDPIIAPLVKHLPKGSDYWWLNGFYVPLFTALIAWLVKQFIDPGLAAVLMFSAFWMVVRNFVYYQQWRSEILDARDRFIESQHTIDALNAAPASKTAGFIVKNAKHLRPSDKKALAKQRLNATDFASLSA